MDEPALLYMAFGLMALQIAMPLMAAAVERYMAKPSNQLWISATEFFSHLGKLGGFLFVGGVGGVFGQLNDIRKDDVAMPAWAWSILAITCFGAASFIAFHKV